MPYQNQIPTDIKLHSRSRILDVTFDDGVNFRLSCELLRVYSPSAAVRGHGPGQEVLQLDKEQVNIKAIEPVGMYAVKLVFDDGHDSGLYSWQYLYELGEEQEERWQDYLQRLSQAGHQRTLD
jgi:DUF971 family protein